MWTPATPVKSVGHAGCHVIGSRQAFKDKIGGSSKLPILGEETTGQVMTCICFNQLMRWRAWQAGGHATDTEPLLGRFHQRNKTEKEKKKIK
jgi:hypothetical protein